MARRARVIIPFYPYHVTHRGNHRDPILKTDRERAVYMSIMIKRAAITGVQIAAFVLMPNHVHFVVVSPTETALSKWIKDGHGEYSRWYNSMHGVTGHNWEGRFYSTLMDPLHCLNALRYTEQNPVRAGLCRMPWNWKWSSAAWHTGCGPRPTFLNLDLRPSGTTTAAWREALLEPTSEDFRRKLIECAGANRPLASDDWIKRMEAEHGVRLVPRPRGRPCLASADIGAAGTVVASN